MISKNLQRLLLAGAVIALGACNKAVTGYGNNSATAETKTTAATDTRPCGLGYFPGAITQLRAASAARCYAGNFQTSQIDSFRSMLTALSGIVMIGSGK